MKLVFVYNADAKTRNGVKDLARKTLARNGKAEKKNDACRLTEITITPLGMQRDWRRFVDGLDAEVEFLHRDEMPSPCKEAPRPALPAAFKQNGDCLNLWITSSEINTCKTLADLKKLVQGYLCEEC